MAAVPPGTETQHGRPAVRLRELRKSFGSVVAVDYVDLDVYDGEFLTLLGPSGSGKTTVLRMIAGFELPTAGRVELGGVDVTNRPPFDLPEAESELVAGYQVEYSSTPYLLFMIGEYANIVLMCAMIAVLFFGGWQAPFPTPFTHLWNPTAASFFGFMWFFGKTLFFFFLFAMVKAVVPRYRYDQLMRLGWKVFLPLSIAAVVLVGGWRIFGSVA